MGIHHGLIAAELSWPALRGHLTVLGGTFAPQGPAMQDDELGPNETGWRLLAGELKGKAYVLDTSMLLSMGGPDALAEVARRTGALVAACGTETVSGSVSLFAARGPQILRWYEHCDGAVSRPLEAGTPLPVEQSAPFGGAGGPWLAQFGFDSEGWLRDGTREAYQFTPQDLHDMGPLERQWDAHCRQYALPLPPLPAASPLRAFLGRLWKGGTW